jgi:predicted nuclease with TOPRIM domain
MSPAPGPRGRLSRIETTAEARVDQELKAYLEEMKARMEEQSARMEEQSARMEEQSARMEEMSARMDGQSAGLEEMRARMDEQFARMETQSQTEARQTRVLLEGLYNNIGLLAEGIMGVTERLETFQEETANRFKEIKVALSPAYKDLDGRVHSLDNQVEHLESRVQIMNNRVRILEARADRQTEDVLESIRKKFGKSQA